MGGAAGSEGVGLLRESGFIDGLEDHKEDLLDDPVLEGGGLGGGEKGLDLALGEGGEVGLVAGGADEEVEAAAPAEAAIEDGVA